MRAIKRDHLLRAARVSLALGLSVTAGLAATPAAAGAASSLPNVDIISYHGSLSNVDNPCTARIEHIDLAGPNNGTKVVRAGPNGLIEVSFTFSSTAIGNDQGTNTPYLNTQRYTASGQAAPGGLVKGQFQQELVALDGSAPRWIISGEVSVNTVPGDTHLYFGPFTSECR